MQIALLSALVVGALAPMLRALFWRVPLPLLSRGMAIRAALGAALVTLLAATIPLIALPPREAGLIGFGFGFALTVVSARRMRHMRGTILLAYRLGQKDSREAALKALVKRFERYRRKRTRPALHARLAAMAVLPLSAHGYWKEALDVLQGVDMDALDKSNRARHGQALATCLMEQGKLEEAEEVLGKIERPADAAVERWLVALEALRFAIVGASEKALEISKEHDPGEGALAASYAVVRAHAYACEGRDKEARAALKVVDNMAGADGLVRATRPVGPATEIAREMLVKMGAASVEVHDEDDEEAADAVAELENEGAEEE